MELPSCQSHFQTYATLRDKSHTSHANELSNQQPPTIGMATLPSDFALRVAREIKRAARAPPRRPNPEPSPGAAFGEGPGGLERWTFSRDTGLAAAGGGGGNAVQRRAKKDGGGKRSSRPLSARVPCRCCEGVRGISGRAACSASCRGSTSRALRPSRRCSACTAGTACCGQATGRSSPRGTCGCMEAS